jgi:hypothetical protein
MQKSIYMAPGDQDYWDEIVKMAQRRNTSVSKLLFELIRTYVQSNYQGRDLGLPVGFRIPASMKDPKLVAAEAAADDIRESVLRAILSGIEAPS